MRRSPIWVPTSRPLGEKWVIRSVTQLERCPQKALNHGVRHECSEFTTRGETHVGAGALTRPAEFRKLWRALLTCPQRYMTLPHTRAYESLRYASRPRVAKIRTPAAASPHSVITNSNGILAVGWTFTNRPFRKSATVLKAACVAIAGMTLKLARLAQRLKMMNTPVRIRGVNP